MRIKHHISGLYKKILTPIGVSLLLFVSFFVVYASNLTTAQWKIVAHIFGSGYAIDKNITPTNIYGGTVGAVCKKITNNCNTGDGIFVPTKTDAEWQGTNGFINKYPSCVTLAECGCKTDADCGGGDVCVGYVAPVAGISSSCARKFYSSNYSSYIAYNGQYYIGSNDAGCMGSLNSNGYSYFGIDYPHCSDNNSNQTACQSTSFSISGYYANSNCSTYVPQPYTYTCQWNPGTSTTPEVMGQCTPFVGCTTDADCSGTPATPVCSGFDAISSLSLGTEYAAQHTVALRSGHVLSWGNNKYGQLGIGSTTNTYVPTPITGLVNVLQLSAKDGYTCAVLNGGTIKCRGNNTYGQLGDGTTISRNVPVAVNGITNAVQVSVGSTHTCAVLDSGIIKCRGQAIFGNNAGLSSSLTPVQVSNITTAVQVSAGFDYTCAVLSDGSAKCWGANNEGELGDGTRLTNRKLPTQVSGITSGATQIVTAERWYTCALMNTGKVRCWGAYLTNTSPYVLTPVEVTSLSGAIQISLGDDYSCATLNDGTAKCWGNSYGNSPTSVGLTGVSYISAGSSAVCAVVNSTSVKCRGSNNSYGQLGNGTIISSATPVYAITAPSFGVCTVPATCNQNDRSTWSSCSLICGGGTQTRTNACGTVQSQSCNTQTCCRTNPSGIYAAAEYWTSNDSDPYGNGPPRTCSAGLNNAPACNTMNAPQAVWGRSNVYGGGCFPFTSWNYAICGTLYKAGTICQGDPCITSMIMPDASFRLTPGAFVGTFDYATSTCKGAASVYTTLNTDVWDNGGFGWRGNTSATTNGAIAGR